MNDGETHNVLFLCTGNSARSILAESILNRAGQGRLRGFSAGSFPVGQVNPFALALLEKLNHPVEALRSKSWDEFTADGAPRVDFVITVCDNAAGEVCPIWPGHPVNAHWGFPDPAAVEGSHTEKELAFAEVYKELTARIETFVDIPFSSLDPLSLQRRMDELGRAP